MLKMQEKKDIVSVRASLVVKRTEHICTYFVAVRLKLDAIFETKEFSIADIERVIQDFFEDFDKLSSVSLESFSSSFCSRSC